MKEYPKSDLLFFRDQLIGQILVTLALFFPYVYKESEVHQGIDKVNGVWSSIYSTQTGELLHGIFLLDFGGAEAYNKHTPD